MRLRQIALVAEELEPVAEDLHAVLTCGDGYRDPGVSVFGLENVVLPLGDTFLEVVSPTRAATSAGRLLERRGGDGGYMVILQVEDLAAARTRAERAGVRVVWEATLDDMATVHLHPRDIGAAIVSLDWADPPEHWEWAGTDWEARARHSPVAGLAGAVLSAADPAALAARWAEALGVPAHEDAAGLVIELDGRSRLRFVAERDARGDGLTAVELHVTDAEAIRRAARERGRLGANGAIEICGTTFELIEADRRD